MPVLFIFSGPESCRGFRPRGGDGRCRPRGRDGGPPTGRGRTTRRSGVSGDAPPIFSFSSVKKLRKRAVHGPKEKKKAFGQLRKFPPFIGKAVVNTASTQGPRRRFPRFAHTRSRMGEYHRLPLFALRAWLMRNGSTEKSHPGGAGVRCGWAAASSVTAFGRTAFPFRGRLWVLPFMCRFAFPVLRR